MIIEIAPRFDPTIVVRKEVPDPPPKKIKEEVKPVEEPKELTEEEVDFLNELTSPKRNKRSK